MWWNRVENRIRVERSLEKWLWEKWADEWNYQKWWSKFWLRKEGSEKASIDCDKCKLYKIRGKSVSVLKLHYD